MSLWYAECGFWMRSAVHQWQAEADAALVDGYQNLDDDQSWQDEPPAWAFTTEELLEMEAERQYEMTVALQRTPTWGELFSSESEYGGKPFKCGTFIPDSILEAFA